MAQTSRQRNVSSIAGAVMKSRDTQLATAEVLKLP